MRVIIYVPDSRGAARTRQAIKRDVEARGHEVVGATSVAAEAKAAWRAKVVDVIAGRPEHLIELAEPERWALPITPRSSPPTVLGIPAPAARVSDRAHPRSRRREVGQGARGLGKLFTVGLFGLGAAISALLGPWSEDSEPGGVAEPPRRVPGASVQATLGPGALSPTPSLKPSNQATPSASGRPAADQGDYSLVDVSLPRVDLEVLYA